MRLALRLFVAACALLGLLALLGVSCEAGDGGAAAPTGEDADRAAVGEPTPEPAPPLVVALTERPDSLDPHHARAAASLQILENVVDTLVQPDAELGFEPALAAAWEVSEDQRRWTFTLREDVTWHDGAPLTPADVVYSLERIREESPHAWRLDPVTEVRVAGERRVVVEVAQPTPDLLARLGAFKGTAIIPAGSVAPGERLEALVGTGPFRLEGQKRSDEDEIRQVELRAAEGFWGDGPQLDAVTFDVHPDAGAAASALRAGGAHLAVDLPVAESSRLAGDEDLVVEATPSNDVWYVGLNHRRAPLDDLRVRRALALGLDRSVVARAARGGAATVNQTPMPPGTRWHVDHAPFSRDRERARELLTAAGVEVLELDVLAAEEHADSVAVAEALARQWRHHINVAVRPRMVDAATWRTELADRSFDAFVSGAIAGFDPEGFLAAPHHRDGVRNVHGFARREVDALIEAARVATDPGRRRELTAAAVERVVDAVSLLYLYNPDVVHVWRSELHDHAVRTDRALRLERVRLER